MDRCGGLAGRWEAASPDGRYLAGFTYAASGWVSPATVVLHEIKTGEERIFPEIARARVHSYWVDLHLVWEPDSQGLLIEDHPSPEAVRTLRLDLESGQAAAVQVQLPERGRMAKATPTGWRVEGEPWKRVRLISPDGRRIDGGPGLAAGWLPDGRLLLIRWENAAHRRLPLSL